MNGKNRILVGALLAAFCFGGAACEKPAGQDGAKGKEAETTTGGGPVVAKEMRRIEVTPEKVAAGKEKYAACAACHGEDGAGKKGIAPRLAAESFLKAASDDYLVATIAEGRPGTTMIAWGNSMSNEEIESVVAYLRDMVKSEPASLNEDALAGNAEDGAKTWAAICAGCHGKTGAGYQETANGTGIGRKGFLDKASDGFIRYMVRNGKSQTAMRAFQEASPTGVANLTDEQVDGVIKYMRANAW